MKKMAVGLLKGLFFLGIGFYLGGKMLAGMINDYKTKMNRNLVNMLLLNDWLGFLYSGGRVEQYFQKRNYHKIMIYGSSYVGARLAQALADTDVEVVALMDKVAPSDADGLIIGADAEIPESDCIVVTPVFYYEEIYDMLRARTDIPIVSMQTIISCEL
ncbi:MAG: hypothetical protein HFI91_09785 [Lachnospiraceae bacterium]|nr:hypothetical protein [Lachnospiraceae bacterium]